MEKDTKKCSQMNILKSRIRMIVTYRPLTERLIRDFKMCKQGIGEMNHVN